MNKIAATFFIFLISLGVYAEEVNIIFEKGNEAFRNKEYSQAIELYESVRNNGYTNSELFYNLGNSYYKNNNLPSAILNYERAIKLNPGDEDIKYNLKLANLKIIDKIEPLPVFFLTSWLDNFIDNYNSDNWSWIFIVFVWITLVGIVLFLLFKNLTSYRRIGFLIMIFGFIFCTATFTFAYKQYLSETQNKNAIVFQPTVYVKNSPDEKGTDLFIVHAGLKVNVMDEVNGWVQAKLADGNIGWIQKGFVEII